jgi:hypothetical protein
MATLGGARHCPCCGDECGSLAFEKRDKLGSQRASLVPLEPYRLTQGEVVIEGVAARAATSPPGQCQRQCVQGPLVDLRIDARRVLKSGEISRNPPCEINKIEV